MPARTLLPVLAAVLCWGFLNAGGDERPADLLPGEELYYVVNERPILFTAPDSSRPARRIDFREPVYVTGEVGDWRRVRTDDGAEGFVYRSAISNIWIRVSKDKKRLSVYRGTQLIKRVPADFGYNVYSNKQQRGSNLLRDHWRTPEGTFYVINRNPNSTFYKAFVLDYPTSRDAERGHREGLISRRQRDAIIRAEESFEMPPMNTQLGGWIEIHGDGTGAATNWTQGCVAVHNDVMDEMWAYVQVGTPVHIE